jgi:hypothetical protein
MKKPPQQLAGTERLPRSALIAVASRARYVGSPEHKIERWWGGLPGVRVGSDGEARRPKKQKTSICGLVTEADRDRATGWVRAAIMARQYQFVEGDQDFPKHIWY